MWMALRILLSWPLQKTVIAHIVKDYTNGWLLCCV